MTDLASLPAEELVALARGGDRSAFEELYRRYYPAVVRRLTYLAASSASVHDLVQETFINAFRAIGRFRGDVGFSHWVLRIATNVARTHHRQTHRRLWTLWARPEQEQAVRAPGVSIDESYPTLLLVKRALDRLSPPLREAVILYELEELSLAEMSATLEIPLHTAASRVRRGREKLRRVLSGMGCHPGAVLEGAGVLCGSDPR